MANLVGSALFWRGVRKQVINFFGGGYVQRLSKDWRPRKANDPLAVTDLKEEFMITAWDIYWITRLDGLNLFMGLIAGFSLTGALVLLIVRVMASDAYFEYEKKICKQWFRPFTAVTIMGVVFMAISIFIPTTKEVAAIYMIPKIVNNEKIQKLPDNAVNFLNKKFEEWIDGMVKKEKK